jgi:hypothetical protein
MGARMTRESEQRLLLLIAIVADALFVLFTMHTLLSQYVDLVPFVVLIVGCLIAVLNIALISMRWRLPRPILRVLCAIALTGNMGLLVVLGLVGLLGLALIGGGGNASMAQIELVVYLVVIAAIIVPNMKLIEDSMARGGG